MPLLHVVVDFAFELDWWRRIETSPVPAPDFNALQLRDAIPTEAPLLVD